MQKMVQILTFNFERALYNRLYALLERKSPAFFSAGIFLSGCLFDNVSFQPGLPTLVTKFQEY